LLGNRKKKSGINDQIQGQNVSNISKKIPPNIFTTHAAPYIAVVLNVESMAAHAH